MNPLTGHSAVRRLSALLATVLLVGGCGGGESSGSEAPPAPDPPEPIDLFDAIPEAGTTVAPSTRGFNLVHLGEQDWRFTYGGACAPSGVAVRRALSDLSDSARHSALVDHKLNCALGADSNYELRIDASAADGTRHRASLAFASGSDSETRGLTLLELTTLPRETVNQLYAYYIREVILDEIDSRILRAIVSSIISQLARLNWSELGSGGARFATLAERVSYGGSAPSGEAARLTGLVVRPHVEVGASFQPPSRVLVLNHGTGSTPSDLDVNDIWFVVANLLAGRGYLVIAPDNWGRGKGESEDRAETYLMANRVAYSSLDMLNEVLADPRYEAFHDSTEEVEISVMGYSQGAHSAIALWLAHAAGDQDSRLSEVYAGGGPHDVYRSFLGGLELLAGRCDGNPWCREVDGDEVLSYATERILPAYLEYAEVGLALEDLVVDNKLSPTFITGMLDFDTRYDDLKTLLQLNSFTNLVDLMGTIEASDTRFHLFHSQSDRLVPHQNSAELSNVLMSGFDVTFHSGECDSRFYDRLADVGRTGLVHAICGFEMFDRVLRDLESIERSEGAATPGVVLDAGSPWRELADRSATEALGDGENLDAFRASHSSGELQAMSESLRELDSHAAKELAERLSPDAGPLAEKPDGGLGGPDLLRAESH